MLTLGALGCRAPTTDRWQMVFCTADGRTLLTTISAAEVYGGSAPRTERVILTGARRVGASYDPTSERVATLEREGRAGEVVRVYEGAPGGALAAEYRVSPEITGNVCQRPCLSRGGGRVAYLGDLGVVFWADVGSEAGHTHALSTRNTSRDSRDSWGQRGRCRWIGDTTLVVGCAGGGGGPIFVLNVNENSGRFLSYGYLAGVIGENHVATSSFWTPFVVSDATTGTSLGWAKAGHQYCYAEAISPSGEYLLYHEPACWVRRERLFIHHLDSGRRAALNVPAGWTLGSWTDVAAATRSDGPAPENP